MDYPVLLALLPVLPADSCDSVWVEEPMREDSLPSRRHAAMSFARGKEVEPMSQAFFFPVQEGLSARKRYQLFSIFLTTKQRGTA